MNNIYITYIQKLTGFLNKYNLLEGIYQGNLFFDEPDSFYYSATIKNAKKYTQRGYYPIKIIYSGGNSFFSKELALLKCLSEAVERVCQESFKTDRRLLNTYNNLKSSALDPALNINDDKTRSELLGWIKGQNIITGEEIWLPAQYVHYTYLNYRKETFVTPSISTGGATGWSHEQALLTGIFEVLERDALMTAYYLKAKVRRIDIQSFNDSEVQLIQKKIQRYALEWYLFDVTNDINIPVIVSIIIDKTSLGPAVTIGASSGIDITANAIKSVSEAIMSRPWIRAQMSISNTELLSTQMLNTRINLRIERAAYWYPLKSISNLSFWLNLKPKQVYVKQIKHKTSKEHLQDVLKILSSTKKSFYFVDITHEEMKAYGFRVYKVIAPELQGLSLDESQLFHNDSRLKEVSRFYSSRIDQINSIPHPFL